MTVKEVKELLDNYSDTTEIVCTWEGIFSNLKHEDFNLNLATGQLVIDAEAGYNNLR